MKFAAILAIASVSAAQVENTDTVYGDMKTIINTIGSGDGTWSKQADPEKFTEWSFLNLIYDNIDYVSVSIGDIAPEDGGNLYNYIGSNHQEVLGAISDLQTEIEGEDGINNSQIKQEMDANFAKIYEILRHIVESVEHIKDQCEVQGEAIGYGDVLPDNTFQFTGSFSG